MKQRTLSDLAEYYKIDFDKIISEIKKEKAKLVLLQLPDGLKIYATAIVDYLEEKTNAKFIIWLGSCFGACDTPIGLENIKPKIDMLIQIGHNEMMPSY